MIPIPCYRCDGSGRIIQWSYPDPRPGSIAFADGRNCPDCLGKRVLWREEVVTEVTQDDSKETK